MRIRKRAGLVLASAAAFGVGLVAFPGSAGATVPNCTPPTTAGNDSCVKGVVTPSNLPSTFTGGQRLFVRTRTNFAQPGACGAGGCAHTVKLDFDNDGRLNFGTIPTCSVTKANGNGQDIAGVWADCGPGAGAANNAYLSTQVAPTGFGCTANPCVSGQAKGYPSVNACTLIFKGPLNALNQRTLTLYARAPVTSSQCLTNPATNHAGTTNVVLKGVITKSPLSGYGTRLSVYNIERSPLPLIDFYAYVKRGNFIQARCPAGTSPLKVRGLWIFSGTGQANDVFTSKQACT
jgi:hypothetical protein